MIQPRSEEKEPLFLAYGHAVYAAQLFESAMRTLLNVIEKERIKNGFTSWLDDLDQLDPKKTAGKLFDVIMGLEYITDAEKKIIQDAIKQRNILVHVYWSNEKIIYATLNPKGRQWIINDLYNKKELCRKADDIISDLINKYLEKYDTSIEEIANPIYEKWLSGSEPPEEVLH